MAKIYDGSRDHTAVAGAAALASEQNSLQDNLIDALWGFSEVNAGIAATDTPERFVVHAPSAGLRELGAQAYSQQGPTGAYAVASLCCDGKYLYVGQSTASDNAVYNLDPTDGQVPSSGNWSYSPGDGMVVNDLACDGSYVWLACDRTTAASRGLYRLDASSGTATELDDHGDYNTDLVACNGEYTVCVDDTNPDDLHVYQQDGTYDGVYSFPVSYSIIAVCISGGTAYAYGVDSSPVTPVIRSVDLATRTLNWTVSLGVNPDVTKVAMACDGNRIYVGHTRTTIGAVQRTITVYSTYDGSQIAYADAGASYDDAICVDSAYLHVSRGTITQSYRKTDMVGSFSPAYGISLPYAPCCDGVSVFGYDTNNVERYWLGRPTTEFQRVDGDDPNRTPWPGMLAIPTERNL